jgi:endoglucanase
MAGALAALAAVIAPGLAGPAAARDEAPAVDPRGVASGAPNPLAGLRFFVDRDHPSWRQYLHERRSGHSRNAVLIRRIAAQPKFRWFGRFNPAAGDAVRDYVERAQRAGEVPLVATLRHQGKACGAGYTAGGQDEDARTRAWFRGFARGIGKARVVIAFEPDSLGTIKCLAPHRREDRIRLLRYGVTQFARLPNATVYIEGGASDWEPVARTARLLRRVGIAKVRGFMLNATHYAWTSDAIRHGREVSRRLGGKPFVVSTSYNGRGPVHYRRSDLEPGAPPTTVNVYCHPLHRGAGPVPSTATADPKVDAYLWIGRAGYSGGSCNGGPLPVGAWWPERAFMFARNATEWESPPAGTRYGFPRGRYWLRAVAGDQLPPALGRTSNRD